jgi:TolB-like protein/Flp pilus assembly protein TadD
MSDTHRFGRFELRPAQRQLWVDGAKVPLGARAFDVLMALVERRDRVAGKQELLDAAWPGLVVEENNLQVQISTLRRILGADAIVTVPGRGYRFTLQPQALPPQPRTDPKTPAAPSVAVLPFVNLSDEAANEYFADGLSEELVNVLSKVEGLRVASRTSAFSFKGAPVDLPTIGRRLNVAHVLEGSVRKAGTRVRVTAQLIDVASDSHRWSREYDRELKDIFAIQDDIARRVVTDIRAALLGESAPAVAAEARVQGEIEAAAKGRSDSAEAYRLYLQGSFHLNRDTEHDVAQAIEHLSRAVALDPAFARAWALLSFAHFHQAANGWAPMDEGRERARDAAGRALATGPDVAAGHWAMGALRMYGDWDWPGAEAALQRALELAPEDSQMLLAARLMQDLGRLDDAARWIERALTNDPLNTAAHMTAGWQALLRGQPAAAEQAFRRALELSPQRVRIHYGLARAHLLADRPDDALAEAQQEPHAIFRLLATVLAQHARGRDAESVAALHELVRGHPDTAAYQIAEAHAGRGEVASAFEWLRRARRLRDAGLAGVKVDPLLQRLHGDVRWQRFLEAMQLAG